MATTSEEIRLLVTTEMAKAMKDVKSFKNDVGGLGKETKATSGAFSKGKIALAAFAAVLYTAGKVMYSAVKAASALQETTSKFNTVFGESPEILEYANSSVQELTDSYAMSTEEARRYMGSMQDLLVPMGMSGQAASKMSAEIVKLSADLGSFNNVSTSQVMQDISAAVTGSFETMKKYGIVLNETVIKEEARNQGLWNGKGMLDAATKAQVAYSIMVKGSTAAIGDMVRTSGSYANVVKSLEANIANLQARMGNEMLKSSTDLARAFRVITSEGSAMDVMFKGLGEMGNGVLASLASAALRVAIVVTKVTLSYKKMTENVSSLAEAQERIKHAGFETDSRKNLEEIISLYASQKRLTNELSNQEYARSREGKAAAREEAEAEKKRQKALQDSARINALGTDINIAKTKDSTKAHEKSAEQIAAAHKKAADKRIKEEERVKRDTINGIKSTVSFIGSALGEISNLYQQHTQNKLTLLQRDTQNQLDAIDAQMNQRLEAEGVQEESEVEKADKKIQDLQLQLAGAATVEERARIQNQIKEAKDAKKRAAIQAEFAAKKLAIEEAAAAKERKMKRDAAEMQKNLSIAQTLLEIPLAAMRAYSSAMVLPPGVNVAVGTTLAGIATALGGAKLALIKSTPLPEAAEGGIIPGSASGTVLRAGEGGRSEAIIPFENDDAMAKIGGGVTVNVYIDTAIADDAFPETLAVKIDQALTRLGQDNNLRLRSVL